MRTGTVLPPPPPPHAPGAGLGGPVRLSAVWAGLGAAAITPRTYTTKKNLFKLWCEEPNGLTLLAAPKTSSWTFSWGVLLIIYVG